MASTSYAFSIDTTPPVLPDPMQWIRAGFQYGSLDIFSDRTATQAISLLNVSDARSGLHKAEWFAIDSNGVRRSVDAQLNSLTGGAGAGRSGCGKHGCTCQSGVLHRGFRVYETKAGNWTGDIAPFWYWSCRPQLHFNIRCGMRKQASGKIMFPAWPFMKTR